MKKNDEKKLKGYDSGNSISNLIIVSILLIVICSPGLTSHGLDSLSILYSIINHNVIYLLVLVYFILIKIDFGKKYFNYLNIFLVFILFHWILF